MSSGFKYGTVKWDKTLFHRCAIRQRSDKANGGMSARFPIMGVLEEYRGRGIDAVFYHDLFIEGVKKGYTWSEMSWILETNTMMNRAAEMMGGKRYKTYRIYEKEV
ncbi:MAG: hypothetical protein P9L92_01645 [Candidatus Electryonea clarkiae]|nr:hypothetical protein [Candidatus Electryonea clarkiae]MDP8289023.1 hypothetical protein [Candidatus Electryonea clarkiae]